MARLYESSTDYEEHITYAGATIADDYDNPDYLYDREQLAYDGGTTDIQGGYSSTAISYASAVTGYNGSKTVTSTATGTGTGAGTGTEVVVKLRTATGAGTGTSTNVRVIVRFRTATGTGAGTSLNAILHEHLRTGYGSGSATAGDQAVGLHIHPRTGTGSGTGTGETTSRRLYRRLATGTGTGTDTPATWVQLYLFRTPTDNQVDFTGSDYYHGNMIPANRLIWQLYRHYTPGPRGRNVWKLTDGTYTENQPPDDTDIDIIYLGGHDHHVDATERAALIAAGYGDYVN